MFHENGNEAEKLKKRRLELLETVASNYKGQPGKKKRKENTSILINNHSTHFPFKCHHPTTPPGGLTGQIFAVGALWVILHTVSFNAISNAWQLQLINSDVKGSASSRKLS